MSVRSDLETRLQTWADAQSPKIKIAWEGKAFTKPSTGVFLQAVVMRAKSRNSNLGGIDYREHGLWQISVWGLDGKGSAETEDIAQDLVNLFPVVPKFAQTSIEQVGSISQADIIDGWRVVHITFPYRKEAQTI